MRVKTENILKTGQHFANCRSQLRGDPVQLHEEFTSLSKFRPVLGLLLATPLCAAAPAALASHCANFYPAGFKLQQGKLNPPMPALAKPAKGVSFTEPNFKTCEYRSSDHARDGMKTFARNDYSRRQAFNKSNTYYILYAADGSWHLFDANSQKHIRKLTPLAGDAEPQWSASDPNILYYLPINGGTRVHKVDVRTNKSSVAIDFNGRLPSWAKNAAHIWTRSEGSPSKDLRYWGFLVYDSSFKLLGHIVWDMSLNKLVGSRQETGGAYDNVSISPSGRWYVANTISNGIWAWSSDFKRKILLAKDGGIHTDIGIAKNGHDAFVSVDFESNMGDIYYTDLDNCPTVAASATTAPVCRRTVLFSMYQDRSWSGMHFSAKSFDKPGWVVISTYDAASKTGTLPWYKDKVMVVELKASPRIYPIAYTRRVKVTSGDRGASNYWAEPHASVNRNLTRVIFNSNWGNSHGEDIDTYTIRLPKNAFSN